MRIDCLTSEEIVRVQKSQKLCMYNCIINSKKHNCTSEELWLEIAELYSQIQKLEKENANPTF